MGEFEESIVEFYLFESRLSARIWALLLYCRLQLIVLSSGFWGSYWVRIKPRPFGHAMINLIFQCLLKKAVGWKLIPFSHFGLVCFLIMALRDFNDWDYWRQPFCWAVDRFYDALFLQILKLLFDSLLHVDLNWSELVFHWSDCFINIQLDNLRV